MNNMEKFKQDLPESYKVLMEQCKRVGKTIKDIDWDDKQWFLTHEWNIESQEDFKKWLVNELWNNVKLRKEMSNSGYKTKTRCNNIADTWIFNYGWKNKSKAK